MKMLKFILLRHWTWASPLNPGGQVQVTDLMGRVSWTVQLAFCAQGLSFLHGSVHNPYTHTKPIPQSWSRTHAVTGGRQATVGWPWCPEGQEHVKVWSWLMQRAPRPHGLGSQGSWHFWLMQARSWGHSSLLKQSMGRHATLGSPCSPEEQEHFTSCWSTEHFADDAHGGSCKHGSMHFCEAHALSFGQSTSLTHSTEIRKQTVTVGKKSFVVM